MIDISKETGISVEDIIDTLVLMDMIIQNPDGKYVLRLDRDNASKILEKFQNKGYPRPTMSLLKWSPSAFQQAILEEPILEDLDEDLDQNEAIEKILEIANSLNKYV